MAETTALVPAPFYPLVRVDSGASYRFNDYPQAPGHADARERTTAAQRAAQQQEHRSVYTRDGFLIADRLVGTHLDIYV